MKFTCLDDFVEEAKKKTEKPVFAVVEAHDRNTLEAVVRAVGDGIMSPLLIGRAAEIEELLVRLGENPAKLEIIDSGGAGQSLDIAVEGIKAGKAMTMMKGHIESGAFLKAILKKESGLAGDGRLSLFGFFETKRYHKLLAVSDFGLNTYPDLGGKKDIVENAVRLFRALGSENPKVAALSSVERLNTKFPDAVDADALKTMNRKGEIKGCVIEGPISFDLATSAEAARLKEYDSPVAGDADLLLVPDICAGNMLVKSLTGFGECRTAGIVLGARVPIVLTSRSAEVSDKYYSIALAACAAADY